MQIKILSVPIVGGEKENEELNKFLRSKKILKTESHAMQHGGTGYWTYSIQYVEDTKPKAATKKIDYREVLDEKSFARFAEYRKIRKQVASDENIPAFAIFADAEMAEMAKIEHLDEKAMMGIKGIGEKKTEKYGHFFLKNKHN